ncbi:MAG: hypothetical protein HQL25_02670 [Candidatus Omnitrophica bacterium]|nr:hypothetical protein [Candidatus Omnitrophota bacterium]
MDQPALKLWICWEYPTRDIPQDVSILSFMLPSEEIEFQKQNSSINFIFGRQRSVGVKKIALAQYIRMVANAGIVKDKNDRTLREALKNKDGQSVWWFHKVTEKDCESSPIFDQIIQILTIKDVIREYTFKQIELFGCPLEITQVLKSKFAIIDYSRRKTKGRELLLGRALWGRFKFLLKTINDCLAVKSLRKVEGQAADIFISGFWDWSVKKDESGQINDRYFRSVPDLLLSAGKKIGWIVWLDPNYESGQAHRSAASAVKSITQDTRFVIAQSFLKILDVLVACFRFSYFFIFMSYQKLPAFKSVFEFEEMDFYPLFKNEFRIEFLDRNIPRQELIYKSHQRFSSEFAPKVVLTFLDLFLYARAVYAGVRKGSPATKLIDMQHASCSREKVFYVIDSQKEFNGLPDGCLLPSPDKVLAMGNLGQEIFLESGFKSEQVVVTGCSRYNKLIIGKAGTGHISGIGTLNILIVSSMDIEKELVMVDCVSAVTALDKNLMIKLRSHPFADIRKYTGFEKYADKIKCTHGTTLDEDLKFADIVVFSYSTVGEEAFLKGKIVWQWVSEGYNGSVFRDLGIISSFSDVNGLLKLIQSYRADPIKFIPNEIDQNKVAWECFGFKDGQNNIDQQITDQILKEVKI